MFSRFDSSPTCDMHTDAHKYIVQVYAVVAPRRAVKRTYLLTYDGWIRRNLMRVPMVMNGRLCAHQLESSDHKLAD